jgi:hypothetical protein
LQSIVFEPLTKVVLGIEQRVADLEASALAFADSFVTRRIVAQELCVADGGGAQTCVTKAQLDALLRTAVQAGQTAAATEPGTTEQTASAGDSAAPALAVEAAVPSETPPAIDPPAAAGAGAEGLPTVAAATPPAPDKPIPAIEETTAISEAAAVMPSATQPTADRPAVAAGEPGAPVRSEANLIPPAVEPVQTAMGTASANAETNGAPERAPGEEEPAPIGAAESTAIEPEVSAVPAAAPPERAE